MMFTIISKASALYGVLFVFPCVLVTNPSFKKTILNSFQPVFADAV